MVFLQRWHGWCHMKLLPCRRVLCTPYNHTPCHFMQSHIRTVHAYVAVTCHLHFWQNVRDLLRATAVTRGWNGYRNKSHHRKLTREEKNRPPLLRGFEPATFRSRVRRSKHSAIPAPHWAGQQFLTFSQPFCSLSYLIRPSVFTMRVRCLTKLRLWVFAMDYVNYARWLVSLFTSET